MKPDEFEQQLRNQPLRPVPPEWRAEIIDTARRASRRQAAAPVRQSAPWWREWLWPSPQAWAGLAAVWLFLLGLHFTGPADSASSTVQTQSPTPEIRMALAAQRLEMTRLLDGPVESTPPSKPAVPGPRSERTTPSKA